MHDVDRQDQIAALMLAREPEIVVTAEAKLDVVGEATLAEPAAESVEHPLLHVYAHDLAGGLHGLGERYGEEAEAGTKLEHAVAGFDQGQDHLARVLEEPAHGAGEEISDPDRASVGRLGSGGVARRWRH